MLKVTNVILVFFILSFCWACGQKKAPVAKLDMDAYLQASDVKLIYPTQAQIDMLVKVVPKDKYTPAASVNDRRYWDKIASGESGKAYFEEALKALEKAPEVPISDEIYRRANKEGNRGIYKPRYYRSMDRLEKFILAECMENKGRFIPQIEVYVDSIMAMKSWLHPNHDDHENSVLEGKRVSIDLGARKFGMVLALANVLLQDKLPDSLQEKITKQLQWRIINSYLGSCQKEADKSNTWIRSTSNWNAVCTSGTLFTTLAASDEYEKRITAIGCALNSMAYYLSGFGKDGYCSEGTGYWNYGFGHYLYLAQLLSDYTNGKIDLFAFNDPQKLNNVAHFPETFQIHNGMYPPFADGVTRVSPESDNFAYLMAAKYYGAKKPTAFIPNEAVQEIIGWDGLANYTAQSESSVLPQYTYFNDFGIVISRGMEQVPLSIAIKAGHNAENHNHSDVGSYVLVLGEDYIAGDIGAPSYIAGAFSKDNPARSSWGHPVPRINNALQANGIQYCGIIEHTSFKQTKDSVLMDIKPAYQVPGLESLFRTMINDKTGEGTISVKDEFVASSPLQFGTALMVNVDYQLIDDNTLIIQSENQKVKVKIIAQGGTVKITDEVVPVKHLRSGKTSYRIGIDFNEKIKEGSITVEYKPMS